MLKDTLINIENIIGSNYADNIIGNTTSNVIMTNLGNDVVNCNGLNVTLDYYYYTSNNISAYLNAT